MISLAWSPFINIAHGVETQIEAVQVPIRATQTVEAIAAASTSTQQATITAIADTLAQTNKPLPTTTPIPTGTPTDAPTLTPIPGLGATRIRETDGMTMVYVPAGKFLMGSTDDDQLADNNEKPQHVVELDAFWIDQTEVTNAQYQQCVDAGQCEASGFADASDYNAANQPVVGVSWHQANDYATWVGGRLPTEAEWEYACRGQNGLIYPWGNDFDGSKGSFRGEDDGYDGTAPVGSFPQGESWVGVLDMAGNVWEWTADWYEAYPESDYQSGLDGEKLRVLRGGSWIIYRVDARCAARVRFNSINRNNYIGLRAVSPSR